MGGFLALDVAIMATARPPIKTMHVLRFLILVSLFSWSLTGVHLQAQPQNFMVSDYVFTRPAAWEWAELPNSATISVKMKTTDADSGQRADIVFVESKAAGGWA